MHCWLGSGSPRPMESRSTADLIARGGSLQTCRPGVWTVKNKSASLFVNAFQVLNQVLIITKHKCLIYDMYFNEEEKVINFEEFGRNQELKTILCFNESFSFS